MGTPDQFDRSFTLARAVLADIEGVTVKHINDLCGGTVSADPMALMASFPAAYTVDAIALEHGINVMRYGRFGFSESRCLIEFPTGFDGNDLADALAAVLVPYVREQVVAAAADRASYTGNGPIESRDAIRRIS